jgi:hypothetical protein
VAAGTAVTWAVARYYYQRAAAESKADLEQVATETKGTCSGSFRKSGAADDIKMYVVATS